MRRLSILLICLLFSCKTSELSTQSHSFPRFPLKEPMVSIHRGGGFEPGWPENSLESFKHYTEKLPGSMLECDVRMTIDSVFVLMHDDDLSRTSNGSGNISKKTYNELKDIKLKDNFGNETNFHIPRLDSVLLWANGKTFLTLDVKRNVSYEHIAKISYRYGMNNQSLITTYNMEEVQRVGKIIPKVLISAGISSIDEYETIKDMGITDRQIVAFLGLEYPDRKLIEFLHAKKIPVILATIGKLDKQAGRGDKNLYGELRNLGVDIFATDFPFQAYRAIK